jgi:2-succinyl-5-enolpyruvyl-6-hydroxy-3-cyclohexene-1-carboxylate synthase
VLDLTIARLRQIVAAIEKRLQATYHQTAKLTEWSTRTLATFIAAAVPLEQGQKNPLVDEARKIEIRLVGDPTADTEPTAPGADDHETHQAALQKIIEEGSPTAEARNRVGSAERLLNGLGG